MKNPVRLALFGLALVTGCYEDRGVLYVDSGFAEVRLADANFSGDEPIVVGDEDAGAPVTGCDGAYTIFQTHMCALAGACHDSNGSAANLDLASLGWEARLVGGSPKGGGAAIPSMCSNQGRIYL